MNKENLVCVYVYVLYMCVYILFNKNKENPATCNMDGILRPYAKRDVRR